MHSDEDKQKSPYESAPMQTALGLFLPKRENDDETEPIFIIPHVPAPEKKKKPGLRSLLSGRRNKNGK